MADQPYTDERLYKAVVKCVTKMCEGDEAPDPKIVEIGARIIKDRDLKPLDTDRLPDEDPAKKRAEELAAGKKKS